jgi:hypothetical protein
MVTETLPLTAIPGVLESLHGNNHHCKVMIDPWMN